MVVNGVWFFRVVLMSWLLIHGSPAGFDPKTFTGPFLTALAILTYAVPIQLIVLEMYIYSARSKSKIFQITTSIIIFISTIITGLGVFGATIGMWLPIQPTCFRLSFSLHPATGRHERTQGRRIPDAQFSIQTVWVTMSHQHP
jgi:hypothetical protein